MKENFTAHTLSGTATTVTVVDGTDECPICHRHFKARPLYLVMQEPTGDKSEVPKLWATYQCPARACQVMFVATHGISNPNRLEYKFLYASPYRVVPKTFPEAIQKLSPEFCDIFNQALVAESTQLDKICGAGYRRAVEFLVKDFAKHVAPEQAKQIERMWLAECIREFMTDTRLRAVVERATWLGNDETHSTRKWSDKDLQDLKTLIKLSVNYIDTHVTTDEYISAMPDSAQR